MAVASLPAGYLSSFITTHVTFLSCFYYELVQYIKACTPTFLTGEPVLRRSVVMKDNNIPILCAVRPVLYVLSCPV